MTDDTVTVSLHCGEETDGIEVPATLVELLSEEDESATAVVGDLAMLGLAQQAHGIVHHSGDEAGDDLVAMEELTMDLFEERFGRSYAEVTGHSH
jgi:hypothetical protein